MHPDLGYKSAPENHTENKQFLKSTPTHLPNRNFSGKSTASKNMTTITSCRQHQQT